MNPIEPSVDELMWLLAEQNEAAATESFGKRYPQYRDELHKRIRLVNGIRANKPASVAATTTPVFQAREVRGNSTPIWAVAGLLAMFAVTYGVSRVAFAPPVATPAATEVVVNDPAGKPPPVATSGNTDESGKQNLGGSGAVEPLNSQPNPAPARPLTPMERRVSIEPSESTLVQVLNKISLQSGVQFQLAPGVTDMPLTLGFQEKSVAEALTEIAIALNISFLEQDPGNVLIIPAGNQGPVTENTGG